jgi:MoaA/NifB/PqqE/SkfB family radical SAM enzyme
MKLGTAQYTRVAKAFLTRRVPVYAHFGITHRCNLTCKMCGIWRYGNRKEELDLDQIDQMAQRMARLGVVQLSIGGGEPFSCDYLEDAAERFVNAGLNVRVLTNGVGVPAERIEKCVKVGVRNFSISLDSLYRERFDYICEKEGSWDDAVRSMSLISRLLAETKGGHHGLPSINCVVSNLNLEELPDIVRFAKAIGFHVSFLPVELLADPKDGVRNWEARFVRYRPEMAVDTNADNVNPRIDKAYDTLIQMKKEGWPILNSTPYLNASRNYLKTGHFPSEGCDAGRLYFSVAPNGQFTICHRTEQQHLHFLDPKFEEYFQSAAYERSRLMEAGSCEGCMRACWIDTSYMFRTMEGFFETAKMAGLPRKRVGVTWPEARAWAKTDDSPKYAVAK